MKRVKLDNLYESHLPPTDTNVLWVDMDENNRSIRAIHKYDKKQKSWGPYLIGYEYMLPDSDSPLSPLNGWLKTIRKSFIAGNYKTFVQQYADGTYDGTYNVVAILVPELEESIGFVASYNNSEIAIVDNEDVSITVVGDLTLPYDYAIRVVFTPNFNGAWEEKTTVNKLLKVSLTLKN